MSDFQKELEGKFDELSVRMFGKPLPKKPKPTGSPMVNQMFKKIHEDLDELDRDISAARGSRLYK